MNRRDDWGDGYALGLRDGFLLGLAAAILVVLSAVAALGAFGAF